MAAASGGSAACAHSRARSRGRTELGRRLAARSPGHAVAAACAGPDLRLAIQLSHASFAAADHPLFGSGGALWIAVSFEGMGRVLDPRLA